MKCNILLAALLSLSLYASEMVDLDSPLRTISIKNNSDLKAMIYYTDDKGAQSYSALRPSRKCSLFTKHSKSITFCVDGNFTIWFPAIGEELHPIIAKNNRKFIITNKGARYKNSQHLLQNLHFEDLSVLDKSSLSSQSLED